MLHAHQLLVDIQCPGQVFDGLGILSFIKISVADVVGRTGKLLRQLAYGIPISVGSFRKICDRLVVVAQFVVAVAEIDEGGRIFQRLLAQGPTDLRRLGNVIERFVVIAESQVTETDVVEAVRIERMLLAEEFPGEIFRP